MMEPNGFLSGDGGRAAFSGCTLPETNIGSGNEWLEDYFPFWMAYFQGLR